MEQNLSLYRVFHTVARTGNISRGARELFLSQPAVSKSISALEENLGVRLFIRGSRGVTLTEAGRSLYEYTTTAFSAIEQGEETLRQMQKEEVSQIRIGVSTTLCKYMLLPYLQEFTRAFPKIRLTIHCQSTFHTLRLIEKNELDVGLIGRPESLQGIDFYPLLTIQDLFVCTKAYWQALTAGMDEEARAEAIRSGELFSRANIMMLDRENITRLFIDDYLKSRHLTLNEVLEISNMDLLIDFAKIGLGVACVIGKFVEQELADGQLISLPLTDPIPKRQTGFAHNHNALLSPAAKQFISFYEERYRSSL